MAPGSTSRITSRSDRARRRYFWRSPMRAETYQRHESTPAGDANGEDGRGRKPASIPPVRILVFHGYLLRGTGSNIYNASLAHAFAELGHEVHILCQDRHAGELPFVDAVGRWERGELRVEVVREPVRCTAYLPDIGRLLPVYVADEYEGFEAKPFLVLSDEEVER